jgi:hypothetical protein
MPFCSVWSSFGRPHGSLVQRPPSGHDQEHIEDMPSTPRNNLLLTDVLGTPTLFGSEGLIATQMGYEPPHM